MLGIGIHIYKVNIFIIFREQNLQYYCKRVHATNTQIHIEMELLR